MKYTQLLPFMEREELMKIAHEILSGELKSVRLETLFPFLGRDNLHEIVDGLIEKKDVDTLRRTIPFISRDKVLEIYQRAEKGDLPGFDTSRLIPFLDTDKIKEIFRELVKNNKEEEIQEEEE